MSYIDGFVILVLAAREKASREIAAQVELHHRGGVGLGRPPLAQALGPDAIDGFRRGLDQAGDRELVHLIGDRGQAALGFLRCGRDLGGV